MNSLCHNLRAFFPLLSQPVRRHSLHPLSRFLSPDSQDIRPYHRPLYRSFPSISNFLSFSTRSAFCSNQSVSSSSLNMAQKLQNHSDSSLSSPPEEPVTAADTKAATGVTVNGRKRKADVTPATTKRTKTASTASAETKLPVEVKAKSGNGTAVKKTAKKATTTRKKTQDDALPLEERTSDTKLRVGAHVSVAGGRYHLLFKCHLVSSRLTIT
jgi:hypothetical protein